ncbi:hypothetical protein Mapa_001152 [Marchantia paleacea]|nr:hypothetical protein Mapa_001152 [Marchantia paleacea]
MIFIGPAISRSAPGVWAGRTDGRTDGRAGGQPFARPDTVDRRFCSRGVHPIVQNSKNTKFPELRFEHHQRIPYVSPGPLAYA